MANVGGIGGARPVDAGQLHEAVAPAATTTAATLGVGSRGQAVKDVQGELVALGYRIAVDGIFGNQTASAVAQFQKAKGLPSTGHADAATQAALKAAVAALGPKKPATPPAIARHPDGSASARINGKDVSLGKDFDAFFALPKSPRFYAWSGSSGAGGFENEGQGLSVYDVKSGATKKVLSEYYHVDKVDSIALPDGHEALLVSMSDGGLGASHVAVVDPERGEVYRLQRASFGGVANGKLTLDLHADDDDLEKVTGKKTIDLAATLKGPVITNKHTPI